MNQTRRAFLRQLGAAAVLPTLGAWGRRPASRAERVGFAFIGLGNYATNWLAPAIERCGVAELRGVVTGTPAKAEAWKKRYGFPDRNVYDYETFDRIADNPDIQAVYVVLPNSMHAEYAIRAAQAGKHVMVEKPMAVSVAQARAMVEACREAGVKLAVGYRNQFEPNTLEVIRTCRSGELSQIKVIESSFGFRIGDPTQWRLRHAMAGGGALMDVGVYTIQGARYVSGEEPIAVTAQEIKTDPVKFAEVDETLLFQLEFPSGAVASLGTSYNAGSERLYVAAEAGRLEMSPCYGYDQHVGWVENWEGRRRTLEIPQEGYMSAPMDDFAACILENRDSRIRGEEGLQDMRIIEAIYAAARTGNRIELEQP